jgi:glycosyltransferase involved in cell wall biosynthesis
MNLDAAEIERRVNDSYELPNRVLEAIPAPVVTVRTYTYQHAPYIRDCIEGVLAQKTAFPFEYIIGEDFSADGTREIVFEYAQRYPDVIRVVTADYNVGAKANVYRCIKRTRGKYIALCDGDDYWIDPNKLQKQFEFMETNPEYSMCCHDAIAIRHDKRGLPHYVSLPNLPRRLDINNDLSSIVSHIPTASLFARSYIANYLPCAYYLTTDNGDTALRLWCAHHGPIAYDSNIMSIYRLHPTSMSGMLKSNTIAFYETSINLYKEFDKGTNFQHTRVIKLQIKIIQDKMRFCRHRRFVGRFAFFLYPKILAEVLLDYLNLIRDYRTGHQRVP